MMDATAVWRTCVCLAISTWCGCAGASAPAVPPWLQLERGTDARLGYSRSDDPEHALLYHSADDALAAASSRNDGHPRAFDARAGSVVSIEAIDARSRVESTSSPFAGTPVCAVG